ncbi:hypothetical protein L484_025370 [Morus notabilis]|uniref:Legumain prodomain domain-containing protein n=1 Tax=Morus notabilis TaxID=981085 RepID=W9R266_9ROSA|nr:hypothetical protein L484_025370 [Morus notabilis]
MKREKDAMAAVSKLTFRHVKRAAKELSAIEKADCFQTLMKVHDKYCGRLSKFGLEPVKHVVNICKIGVKADEMAGASIKVCSVLDLGNRTSNRSKHSKQQPEEPQPTSLLCYSRFHDRSAGGHMSFNLLLVFLNSFQPQESQRKNRS